MRRGKFDEAVSNLDGRTAERFARAINQLKGKANNPQPKPVACS